MRTNEKFGEVPQDFQQYSFNEALYALIKERGGWDYVLYRMSIISDPHPVMYSMNMTPVGELILGIRFDHFVPLSYEARKCLLRLPCLHFLVGHLSTNALRLRHQYGDRVFELACELVVSQIYSVKALWDEGFMIAQPELYGFPADQSTEQYCQLLQNHLIQKFGQKQIPNPKSQWKEQQSSGTGSGTPSPAEGAAGGDKDKEKRARNNLPKSLSSPEQDPVERQTPPDWIKNGAIDKEKLKEAIERGEVMVGGAGEINQMACGQIADATSREIITGAYNRSGLKTQGWFKGEALDFFKSLHREPVIEWIDFLREKESQCTDLLREPTRRRLSRRHSNYFGRKHQSMCHVVVWIDTSGSMSPRELRLIQSELQAMVRRGAYVEVAQCDADVQSPPTVFRDSTELEQFFGGGGTDFRPAFEYMATKLESPPDVVVYFTDGYGTAPEVPPSFMESLDILWVLTDKGMSPKEFSKRVCPWGMPVVFDTVTGVDEKDLQN